MSGADGDDPHQPTAAPIPGSRDMDGFGAQTRPSFPPGLQNPNIFWCPIPTPDLRPSSHTQSATFVRAPPSCRPMDREAHTSRLHPVLRTSNFVLPMSYTQALELARVAALESLVHTMRNADTWAERRRAAIAVLEAPEPNEPERSTPTPAPNPPTVNVEPKSKSASPSPDRSSAHAATSSADSDHSESATSDIRHPTSDISSDRLSPVRPNADEPHRHAHDPLDHLDVPTRPGG